MLKKSRAVLKGILVLGLATTILTPSALAETTSELRNQQAQVQEERELLQSELSEAEQEVANVLAELDELAEQIELNNQALEDNQNMIDETEEKIDFAEKEIEEIEEEIVELEKDIDTRVELLKQRAVTYQKSGTSINYLQVILGANSFGDFLERIYTVSQIAQADADFIQQLNDNIAAVEDKRAAVEEKLNELTEMSVELEGMQEHIKAQIEITEELEAELVKKEQENQDILDELKNKDSQLAQREAQIRASIRRNQTQSSMSSRSSSSAAPQATVIPNGTAADVIDVGKRYIGNSRYVFGGGRTQYDIQNGRFDCSGFTGWAFSQIGMNIGYSTSYQSTVGQRISYSEARPGDLVFFNTYKTNGHVGIYVGNGKFIGSQNTTGVAIADMNSGYWKNHFSGHVRRVLN